MEIVREIEISPRKLPYWLLLARCPDCFGALTDAPEGLCCSWCRQPIQRCGRTWNLLPKDWVDEPDDSTFRSEQRAKRKFIRQIYARHNDSPNVRRAVSRVLECLAEGDFGLNLGAGGTALHPQMVNLDVTVSDSVDVLGDAHAIPFRDEVFRCVICQEVLEHLQDPCRALAEVYRILQPGGTVFLTVPFIIGFHSGPHDYWRFSQAGLEEMARRAGLGVVECGPAVGAGTSAYRIGVELSATLAALLGNRFYLPVKALAAVGLSPLRWLDRVATEHSATNRISAGFYLIGRK